MIQRNERKPAEQVLRDVKTLTTSMRHTRRLLALAYLELGGTSDPRLAGHGSITIEEVQKRGERAFSGTPRALTTQEVDMVLEAVANGDKTTP